ncbi:efflux RND transporter periplasmic adaptor subunit [Luteolibacter pohnpeiensis]|uniref:Efflux RND transporter periplasmic adaptor subunit n=1 Tax=Luteolibacter pohnpeiensis TaxID=454153 RepID=A0A934S721_9BACT|nr:efflux RND transporter periplasmic adaptor subunit [Luteolibacter pohnpeiensis]MBK1882389.1 efflux RND transporter periplasmic adaptor subunit [Luteolibacter pohnpeiensis]
MPWLQLSGAEPSHPIVLDDVGMKNLRIETVMAEETTFAETIFALGRIEAIPERTGTVSSRISGRVIELSATPGSEVHRGQEVARVESRQPGDPPPTISLTAPLGGIITHLDTRLGDPVEPDKPLLEIVDLGEVDAYARVPEDQVGKIKIGTKAHIRIAALPDQSFDGELLRFGTTADRESGTIDAVFRIPNSKGMIRPGMRAEFSIVVSERENVLSIPRTALQGDASNRFVYVRDFDLPNVFEKAPVQIGEMNDRNVEIIKGLFPADDVVTRGAYSLVFAGGGTVSLKEALDAAHGHEHAEDGSELTPEKKAQMAAEKRAAAGLDSSEPQASSKPWKILSGVLAVLLLASLLLHRPKAGAGKVVNPNQKEA